jgi:hypothetical protein
MWRASFLAPALRRGSRPGADRQGGSRICRDPKCQAPNEFSVDPLPAPGSRFYCRREHGMTEDRAEARSRMEKLLTRSKNASAERKIAEAGVGPRGCDFRVGRTRFRVHRPIRLSKGDEAPSAQERKAVALLVRDARSPGAGSGVRGPRRRFRTRFRPCRSPRPSVRTRDSRFRCPSVSPPARHRVGLPRDPSARQAVAGGRAPGGDARALPRRPGRGFTFHCGERARSQSPRPFSIGKNPAA